MKLTNRMIALAVAGIGLSIVALPVAARASEEGRRNTALGLGAAAAALLLGQRDKTAGVVAALGAAYAFSQVDRGHRYDRDRYDRDRYSYGDRYYGRYDGDDRYYGGDRHDGWGGGYDRDHRAGEHDRRGGDYRDRGGVSDRYARSDGGSRSYRR